MKGSILEKSLMLKYNQQYLKISSGMTLLHVKMTIRYIQNGHRRLIKNGQPTLTYKQELFSIQLMDLNTTLLS